MFHFRLIVVGTFIVTMFGTFARADACTDACTILDEETTTTFFTTTTGYVIPPPSITYCVDSGYEVVTKTVVDVNYGTSDDPVWKQDVYNKKQIVTCCDEPDENYPIDAETFKIADGVPDVTCNEPPETLTEKTEMCNAWNGVYTVISKINCCEVSACLVDINASAPLPPVDCPPNSTYDVKSEGCRCNSPYTPEYTILGDMICVMPDCPSFYAGTPPLPLFMQTDNVNKCNFFSLGDGAVLNIDGLVCCYGQEGSEPSLCGTNAMEINGQCYPITENNDTGDDVPECSSGEYYSIITKECVSMFPDANTSNPSDANTSNPSDVGGLTDGSEISLDGNGTILGDTLLTSSNADSMNIDLDGVKSALDGVMGSYVFIKVPVTVSGSCDVELVKTFTFPLTGSTYTIDASVNMAKLDPYMPIFHGLILFLFGFGGVIIVLSSSKGD